MQTKQENQLEIKNDIGTAGYARTVGEDGKSYRTGISALVEGVVGDDVEELEEDVASLKLTVEEHTADIQNNTDDISDLQTTTSSHTTSIGNLQTAVGTNTTNISNLQSTVSGHTTSIGNLQTAVGTNTGDIANLKEDITYSTITRTDYIDNKYINNNANVGSVASLTYNDSTSYKCMIFEVRKGDYVTITGLGGNAARLWCLVDKDNYVIAKADANHSASGEIIHITVDGKLACDFYTSVPPTVIHKSGVLGKVEELVGYESQIDTNTKEILTNLGGSVTSPVELVIGYVDYSNGTLSNYDSASKYKRTNYIEIPDGVSMIETTCVGNASGGWAVYDQNHTYITGAQTTTILVKSNYKYIALSSFDSTSVHANKTITFVYVGALSTVISCWGDSITEGMYLDGNHSAEYGKAPYPAHLTTILTDKGHENFKVNNYGHGGECMPDISARLGSVCAYTIEDITVAGDGTPTQIGTHAESGGLRTDSKIQIPFNNKNGDKYNVAFTQIANDTNPITINGDEYTLSISSQTIYLSQTSGASITIPKGSLIFTNDDRNSTVDIVYGGVNDAISLTLEKYLSFMAKVAEKNPKYLCIGCQNALFQYWGDVQGETIAEKHDYYADACMAQMGVRFVDLYNDFYPVAMEYALDGGFFTDKTAQQISDMEALLSQKIMPAEFSYDGAHQGNVHLSSVGYYVMARIIYNRLLALNYI